MKKKFLVLLIIAAVFFVFVFIPFIMIKVRAPVLIVTEESFLELYGEDRVKSETFNSTAALMRTIKTVSVANETGDDLVSLAVSSMSAKPYCVIFPLRFARAAKLYREQNPGIKVILLEGRFPEYQRPSSFALGGNDPDFFIYKTDIETDFYRTGYAAAAIISSAVKEKTDESNEQESAPVIPLEKRTVAVFWGVNIANITAVFKDALSDFVNGKIRKRSVRRTEPTNFWFGEQVTDTPLPQPGGQVPETPIPRSEEQEETPAAGFEEQEESSELEFEELEENRYLEFEEEEGGANLLIGEQETEYIEQIEALPSEGAEFSTWNPSLIAIGREQAAEREKASFFSAWEFAVLGWLRAVKDIEIEEVSADQPAEELIPAPDARFYSLFSQFSDDFGLSCVVLVDSGLEYLDRKTGIPVIIFSWLDLNLMPKDVVIAVDDSPWAQAVMAVRMAGKGKENGLIPSKFHFLDKNLFNRELLRKIKKSWKNDKISA